MAHIAEEYMNFEMGKPNFAGFVVIGAGLPRTGTMSTRAALMHLLDGACYHMLQVSFGEPIDVTFWDKAVKRKPSAREWKDFLEGRGFRAGVDYPISLFYKEIMEAFPNAKVLLTTRDPETWYESVKNSIMGIGKMLRWPPVRFYLWLRGGLAGLDMTNTLSCTPTRGWDRNMFGVVSEGKEASVKFYNDWIEDVKRTVPKDRLLVFSVKEGWEPLCKFLDLPVPKIPFPRVNDTAAMKNAMARGQREAFFFTIVLPAIIGVAFYYRHSILKFFGLDF